MLHVLTAVVANANAGADAARSDDHQDRAEKVSLTCTPSTNMVNVYQGGWHRRNFNGGDSILNADVC